MAPPPAATRNRISAMTASLGTPNAKVAYRSNVRPAAAGSPWNIVSQAGGLCFLDSRIAAIVRPSTAVIANRMKQVNNMVCGFMAAPPWNRQSPRRGDRKQGTSKNETRIDRSMFRAGGKRPIDVQTLVLPFQAVNDGWKKPVDLRRNA